MSDNDPNKVSVRLYSDGSGGGYQLGYRGHYVRAASKEAAWAKLKEELEAAGIPLPPAPKL